MSRFYELLKRKDITRRFKETNEALHFEQKKHNTKHSKASLANR
jgi:hypothetical protein